MITSFEIYQVSSEFVTADLIVWNRYKQRAPGVVEIMLDTNPQIAAAHKASPFLPVGLLVRVPIDLDLIRGKPSDTSRISLWTDARGFTN